MGNDNKTVSLTVAATLTVISTVVVFIAFVGKDYGVNGFKNIFGEPVVFRHYIAQAIGGSIGLPALNVALVSLFKSKRNSSTRRRIFIGWSIVIIALQVLSSFLN